ncbi:MAG: hypothetical protein M3A24_05175, partial [Candidatus Rhabdochlamydia oedothoracis]|nr:hypothetical protein [Candidatus Rhabdochlamydia oedothoracis]
FFLKSILPSFKVYSLLGYNKKFFYTRAFLFPSFERALMFQLQELFDRDIEPDWLLIFKKTKT